MSANADNGVGQDSALEIELDDDALLCALVLAPPAFSRNRFFSLFESPERRKLRRRASRVRGIIRQMVEPERGRAELVGERVLEGLRHLRDPPSVEETTA